MSPDIGNAAWGGDTLKLKARQKGAGTDTC